MLPNSPQVLRLAFLASSSHLLAGKRKYMHNSYVILLDFSVNSLALKNNKALCMHLIVVWAGVCWVVVCDSSD